MNAVQLRSLVKAMTSPDDWVVKITYVDAKQKQTERIISPIRFGPKRTVLAMCLGREDCRSFKLDGIASLELVSSNDVLMPEPIVEKESDGSSADE